VGLLVLAVTPAFRGRRGGAVAFALSALCCVDIGLLVTSLLRHCMLHWMWLYPSCDVVFLLFCSEEVAQSHKEIIPIQIQRTDFLLLLCVKTTCLDGRWKQFSLLRRCLLLHSVLSRTSIDLRLHMIKCGAERICGATRHWLVLIMWFIRILSLSLAVCIQQSATLTQP